MMIFELVKRIGQKDGLYHIHQQGSGMALKIDKEPLVVKSKSEAKALLVSLGHGPALDLMIVFKLRGGPDVPNSFFLHGH